MFSHDLPTELIGPDSLSHHQHLGVGLGMRFRQLRFLLRPQSVLTQPIQPGRLLIAVWHAEPSLTCNAPDVQRLDRTRIAVLRAQEMEGWPERGTHEWATIETWLHSKDPSNVSAPDPRVHLGVLRCELLGLYQAAAAAGAAPIFCGDMSMSMPVTCLHLYQPDAMATEMLVNGTLPAQGRIPMGWMRSGEDVATSSQDLHAHVAVRDLLGKRTALFGKTRLGKSNTVKLMAQGILDLTRDHPQAGQIIFDVNGEYANINPQDGESALASAYKDRCVPYFLAYMASNPDARYLRFNFHEVSEDALAVMQELLPPEVVQSPVLSGLFTCRLPALVRHPHENDVVFQRRLRKIMLCWTLLDAAGFDSDSDRLKNRLQVEFGLQLPFNPGFGPNLRKAAYLAIQNIPPPTTPFHFTAMALEMRVVARFSKTYPNDPSLSPNGQYLFDTDEEIMIDLLCSTSGPGPSALRPCMPFHSPRASDFTHDILEALAQSKTVVLNLGSANEQIIRYFSKSLCLSIFHAQERKFVNNQLDGHYVQIYFEEAHMIFPPNQGNVINVYSRFAKEGAKFNIGIVYCTQSPTTVNMDLLSQTENFFIGHLASRNETDYLSAVQVAFQGCEDQIMRSRTPGFMQMLTHSHRYVVPVQMRMYDGKPRELV